MNPNTSGRNYGKCNRIFFQLNVFAGPRELNGGSRPLDPIETPGSVSTLDAVGGFASGVLDVAGGLLRRALYMFLVHVDFSG